MKTLFIDMDETIVSTKPLVPKKPIDSPLNLFTYPQNLVVKPGMSRKEKLAIGRGRRQYYETKIKPAMRRQKSRGDVRYFIYKDGSHEEEWLTKLRPYTVDFVNACKKIFDKVYILTAGGSDFQKHVMKAHGILHLFDGLFSTQDNWLLVPQHKGAILIDNLGLRTLSMSEKLSMIGHISLKDYDKMANGTISPKRNAEIKKGLENYFINVRDFNGEEDDKELVKIWSERLQKIFV